MSTTSKPAIPAEHPNSWDEVDIGSGEKSAGQRETDELIKQIPVLPKDQAGDEDDMPEDGDADDYANNGAPDDELAEANMEQEMSLEKDEPSSQLDKLDPVPPRG